MYARLHNFESTAIKTGAAYETSDCRHSAYPGLITRCSSRPCDSTPVDLPLIERGGDGNTVIGTSGPNFRQTHGASFREILDVSDWDRLVATSVPGQSGQPGSKHYGDLLPLWAEGKYFPLLYGKQKVEAMAKERLTLEPAR